MLSQKMSYVVDKLIKTQQNKGILLKDTITGTTTYSPAAGLVG